MSEGLASFLYRAERDVPPEIDVGALIRAEIELADTERTFAAHARVIERKSGDVRGARLELLREEPSRQELILLAARGESIPYRRRAHPRHPCGNAARLRVDQWHQCEIRDVSRGGFHAACDLAVEVGTPIKIEVDVHARVLSARVVGRILGGPSRGICCEWSLRSREQKDAIDAWVRSLV